jgi:hypothetical protein
MHTVCHRVEEAVGFGALFVAEEYHGGAAVVQFLEAWARHLGVCDAPEDADGPRQPCVRAKLQTV